MGNLSTSPHPDGPILQDVPRRPSDEVQRRELCKRGACGGLPVLAPLAPCCWFKGRHERKLLLVRGSPIGFRFEVFGKQRLLPRWKGKGNVKFARLLEGLTRAEIQERSAQKAKDKLKAAKVKFDSRPLPDLILVLEKVGTPASFFG